MVQNLKFILDKLPYTWEKCIKSAFQQKSFSKILKRLTQTIYLLINLKFYRHCYKFMQLSFVLRFFFEEYEWDSGYSQSQLLLYIYKRGLKVVAAFAYKNERYLCFPWVLLNWFSLCCIQMPPSSSTSYSLCILIFLIKRWKENYWLWIVY